MIRGFFLLLLCQLVGEVLARGLGLPAPGPVIGLALLTLGLAAWTRRRPMSDDQIAASDVGRAATGLLGSLSLLFRRARAGRGPSSAGQHRADLGRARGGAAEDFRDRLAD